ncbi:hypothetical protein E2562_022783 [Oryza meyeriana var. granulata]|uniref:U-box domain-containing protein n=1 Tax=Oryza meyeriana var. granulata TaxID=110450 RepID=A0A6G1FB97_9ORYZ|nr:hypothetical protein E2562_022783 [Oryza meyeriana var. granulata]
METVGNLEKKGSQLLRDSPPTPSPPNPNPGAMSQLLLMVQGGCSERAKRKAQHLLKLLRSAWPAADSIANSDDFLQPY